LEIARYRPLLRRVETAVLTLIAIALAVLFGVAMLHAAGADVTKCANRTAADSATGLRLAVVALLGFAAGRLVAMARKWIRQGPDDARDHDEVRTGGLLQGALAAFLIVATLLLGYETYALANAVAAPPITEYVRCAAANSPTLVGIAAFGVSLLVGNWLWYPSK
jgi:hypothetical protein